MWWRGSLLLLVLASAETASAGFLVSPGIHWRTFSFEETDTPITPNYYGIGGSLNLGYSFHRVVDLGLHGAYTPATLTNVEFGKEDAMLAGYGAQIGLRVVEAIFIGFRSGRQIYSVHKRRKLDDEIDGRWSGSFYGASLGGVFAYGKETCWQVFFDATRAKLKRDDISEDSSRNLDSFSVSLAFVFNARERGSNILGGFINGL